MPGPLPKGKISKADEDKKVKLELDRIKQLNELIKRTPSAKGKAYYQKRVDELKSKHEAAQTDDGWMEEDEPSEYTYDPETGNVEPNTYWFDPDEPRKKSK